MSLEQSLDNHTKAIYALIEVLGGKMGNVSISGTAEPTKGKAEAKKSAPNAKAAEPTNTQSQEVSTAVAQDARGATELPSDVAADASSEASTVSFSTARDLVLKLASANKRDEVKAVNTKHGITKLGSLLSDESDYNTVTDPAKLAAVYADLLAIEV